MKSKISEVKEFLLKDKRKSDRLALPIKMAYTVLPENKWSKPILIEDISGHGIKFIHTKAIDLGTELNLKIILPGGNANKPISVKASTVWCKPANRGTYQIGVNFNKMDSEDRKRFIEYMSDKLLVAHLDKELTI